MAAEPGFEPGLKDSKSSVLPLHNSAIGLLHQGLLYHKVRPACLMLLAIFIHIPTALRRSKGLLFALNRFDRGSSLGYNNSSS